MTLRCVFHVSPTVTKAPAPAHRERMPSTIDVEVELADEPLPRGRSYETWTRARGWASED